MLGWRNWQPRTFQKRVVNSHAGSTPVPSTIFNGVVPEWSNGTVRKTDGDLSRVSPNLTHTSNFSCGMVTTRTCNKWKLISVVVCKTTALKSIQRGRARGSIPPASTIFLMETWLNGLRHSFGTRATGLKTRSKSSNLFVSALYCPSGGIWKDALDLGSSVERRAGSIPVSGTSVSMEAWLSGLKRMFAKHLTTKHRPQVRILSPPSQRVKEPPRGSGWTTAKAG